MSRNISFYLLGCCFKTNLRCAHSKLSNCLWIFCGGRMSYSKKCITRNSSIWSAYGLINKVNPLSKIISSLFAWQRRQVMEWWLKKVTVSNMALLVSISPPLKSGPREFSAELDKPGEMNRLPMIIKSPFFDALCHRFALMYKPICSVSSRWRCTRYQVRCH